MPGRSISAENDRNDSIAYFLRATAPQAAQNAQRVNAIFSKPIFQTSELAQRLTDGHGIHEKTAACARNC